jgi:twinkle protein
MDYHKTMLDTKGKVQEQTHCPFEGCGSSDAFTIYLKPNGIKDAYCWSCGGYSRDPDTDLQRFTDGLAVTKSIDLTNNHSTVGADLHVRANPVGTRQLSGLSPVEHHGYVKESTAISVSREDGLLHPIRALTERKLEYATALHFNVHVGVSQVDGDTPIYTLFPRYKDKELVGWKTKVVNYTTVNGPSGLVKTPSKSIVSTGGGDVDLFGTHCSPSAGKRVWITEGEEDAMACYQVLKQGSSLPDWEPAVVSLPDGCKSCIKSLSSSLEFLNQFEEVVIVFDNDVHGKQARIEACKLLAGKASYVQLPLKDANEMLLQNRATDLKWLLYSGKKYQPDGILNAKDLWERYNDKKDVPSYPYPPQFTKLNLNTYGVRPGSIVTVTSGTGSGKTQFLRELLYHYWVTTDEKIAGMFLEEDVSDTLKGLISLDLNKRIHLPDVVSNDEQELSSFSKLFDSGRISLYDYFGGMDDGSLLAKLRYFASTGHKFIFLDHLSIVVSEYAAEGGERERIDTLMTKLAKFVKEFNCVLFLVVHLRKSDLSRTSFELGARPTLDDLRGSGSLKQLSWDVIGLTRNQQHEDKYCANTTEVSVLKCRFTGRTGTCDYLHFDETNGRLLSVEKPANWGKKKMSSIDSDTEF